MTVDDMFATERVRPPSRWNRLTSRLARRRHTGIAVRDLLDEAVAGVAARPGRFALTTLGTVVGIAALVTTIGLGQTASGQISERFDAATATRVVVEPMERPSRGGEVQAMVLPSDSEQRVLRLAGVESAGLYTRVDIGDETIRSVPIVDPSAPPMTALPVVAASAGLFDAMQVSVSAGRVFDSGHDERADDIAVVGKYAAERLGINRVDTQPALFIGERPFTVVGIIDTVSGRADLQDSVIIPHSTAQREFDISAPAAVEIRTQLGAAHQVGKQAGVAINPNDPALVQVSAPPSPSALRAGVTTDINALFLALGVVALLIGAVGIAAVTLLSVAERTSEIGLRRAVGATRRSIAGQFLCESVIVGVLGGLIGSAVAVLSIVAVSAVRDWTPLLDMRIALAAPLIGAAVGAIAGAYPAWRAAAVEPIDALRG
ncbi:ABC transporter permease [Hoyosella rhizosphaerae]|uniref:ABC transporter permease n=1 Tax=Hoyosella rhizosphaerae TaxID=1755582 RepID=A0A916U1J2_9ACTN|nr:ABC transporter permease [Hoyosella rhizosphaerae]MBN4927027.1 ABC transporter permease [Hoyosella rhizosphaerae]GGC54629.1 ABC transporter permease [Hoyosella rhizosphaerae]